MFFRKSILSLILLLFSVANCLAQETKESLTEKAVLAFHKGDLTASIAYFDLLIAKFPNDSTAYFDRGFVKGVNQDIEGAIVDYTKQISINNESIDSYFLRGIMYQKLGKNQLAIEDYEKVTKMEWDNADAHYFKGQCELILKQKRQSLKSYKSCVKVNPLHTEAILELAKAYQQKRRIKKSLEILAQGIVADSNDANFYFYSGFMEAHYRKNYYEAIRLYNIAIQLAPDEVSYFEEREKCLELLKEDKYFN
jgi:tetratricopeptide (TPR) repeat protein